MNSHKNSRNQLLAVGETHKSLLEKLSHPAMLTLGIALSLSAVPPLSADIVYTTASLVSGGGALQVVNTATNTVSNLFTDPRFPQDLIFSGANDILYTTEYTSLGVGTVSDYNLLTHSSSDLTTLAIGRRGSYLALDPGGATVLFDIPGTGIERLNLSTHTVTNVSNNPDPRGLAYDAAGHLFSVLGGTTVAQIDPVSGAVIKSISIPSVGANGLAFDPVSGHLFVSVLENGPSRGIFEIPTDLSSATLVLPGLVAAGLVGDSSGHLFIAGGASGVDNVDEYTIATHTLTTGPLDFGINDVAVAPTTTVPPPPPPAATPEPASLLLFGIGLGTIGILQRRFR